METSNVKATYNQSVDRELSVEASDLLKRLTQMRKEKEIRDDEITIRDYSLDNNVPRGVARHCLETLVREGVLTKRMAVHNGRETLAYREVR